MSADWQRSMDDFTAAITPEAVAAATTALQAALDGAVEAKIVDAFPGHRIEWRIEYDSVRGKIICTAPEGARCRLFCARQDCRENERGCHCGDPVLEPIACNVTTWITESGTTEEFYAGGSDEILQSGPVATWWDGDNYVWAYLPVGADPLAQERCGDPTTAYGGRLRPCTMYAGHADSTDWWGGRHCDPDWPHK